MLTPQSKMRVRDSAVRSESLCRTRHRQRTCSKSSKHNQPILMGTGTWTSPGVWTGTIPGLSGTLPIGTMTISNSSNGTMASGLLSSLMNDIGTMLGIPPDSNGDTPNAN